MDRFPQIENAFIFTFRLVAIGFFMLQLNEVSAQKQSLVFKTLYFNLDSIQNVSEIKSADLDNDGKPDLVMCYNSSNSVQVFLNAINQTGDFNQAFNEASDFSFASGFGAKLLVVDLNGDQLPEIILTHRDDSDITIFQNVSTMGKAGFLNEFQIHFDEKPTAISACDFNNDGFPELIVSSKNNIFLLENTVSEKSGTSSFVIEKELKSPDIIYDIKCADMDGDGNVDIIAGLSDGIAIYKNAITSPSDKIMFEAAKLFKTGCIVYAFDIGDIDNDFRPDIVAANWPNANITIMPNVSANGSLKIAESMHIESGAAKSIVIGDIDGDGKFDITIVAAGAGLNVTQIFTNASREEGDFNFNAFKNYNAFTSNPIIQDFDRDGKEDLAGISAITHAFDIITENKSKANVIPYPEVFCDEAGQTFIQWESDGIDNSRSYSIEKSMDGKTFNSIGNNIQSEVIAGKSTYHFVEPNAKGDIAYYRLKISTSNATNYSDISISNPCSNSITEFICAYPNPADKSMNFKFSLSNPMTMHYILLDLNMQPQLEKIEQVSAGTRTYSLDISQLTKGSYIFAVYFGNLTPQVCRFEKL